MQSSMWNAKFRFNSITYSYSVQSPQFIGLLSPYLCINCGGKKAMFIFQKVEIRERREQHLLLEDRI